MGLGPNWSTGDWSPNPDPYEFELLEVEDYANGYAALLVEYKGCTTYNGKKLLVIQYSGKLDNFLSELDKLDPHLLDDHFVVARFVPTQWGALMARRAFG